METVAPIFRANAVNDQYPNAYPLEKRQENPHGKVRYDHYATANGSQQSLVSCESGQVQLPGGIGASVAVGQDFRPDRGGVGNPAVGEILLTKPITGGFSSKTRVRTTVNGEDTATQFRTGLQYTHPLSSKDSVYAQIYAADKIRHRDGDGKFTVGGFAGIDHKFTDNLSGYAEVQAYGFERDRANLGFNTGLRLSF